MNISFRKGNLIHLLISTLIYVSGVVTIPLMILPYVANEQKINVLILTSFIAVLLLSIYSFYAKNSIDKNENKISFIQAILLGILGFLALLFLQGTLNILLQKLNLNSTSNNTTNIIKIINNSPLFIGYVIFLGPILEELFFRKALFGYLYDIFEDSSKFIRFFIPSLITGIAFALPHDGISPIMIIYIIMSFVFSFMYVKTKRIIAPMTAHILMNSLVVLAQVLASQLSV